MRMDIPHTKFLCRTCSLKEEPNKTPLVTDWFGDWQKCGSWEQLCTQHTRSVLYLKI